MAERGEPLTDREKEVLGLVATGITNREVAQKLFISVNTVKVHLRNVYAKLGADSRTEATMIAVREGWVVVDEGATAGGGPETAGTEGGGALAPPLPWPKRFALLGALVVVVFAVIVTWPRSQPQAAGGLDLPLDRSQSALVNGSTGDAESAWQERAQMPTRRAHLALSAVDGRLLAIGGQTPEGVTAAVEAYDPEDDIWTPLTEKPLPVAYVGAARIGNDVYVPGGCDAENKPTQVVEVYDVGADAWRQVTPLPQPRCAYALVARGEELYLFGGWDGEQYVSTAYVYDSAADSWSATRAMGVARGFAGAAPLDGRIYVVGGYDGRKELAVCAFYDPPSEVWSECAPLTVGRGGLGLAAIGAQLYAVGGGGWSSYLGFNERYNPGEDTWQPVETPLVGEWRDPGVAVLGASIYAVGGWSHDYLSLTQSYETLPFRIFIPVSHQQ